MEGLKLGINMIWLIFQMNYFNYLVKDKNNDKNVEVFLKRGNSDLV